MKLISKKKRRGSNEKVKNIINTDSKFAIVEGYKSARTSLVFSLVAENNPCVAVTSWSKGEGKSTATVNLAISFAKMGKNVLLIDTDLRRPNIHNLLKISNSTGLSEVVGQLTDFEDAVNRSVVPCLDVLTSGSIPPNPSELIGSSAFTSFINMAKNQYDYVILDTPPIGVVTDTLLLKEHIAGYVMIVREKVTTHGEIEKAVQAIKLADSKILGFLKVGCSLQDRKRYKGNNYGYYKYY
ncbi:MAG: CpsD/CapB family tyrosine-protein kinase [Eubacteriales bacterium]|nr:CpsD/CapB family tyrosine-protein kinase [Eubacteriales bacterium]